MSAEAWVLLVGLRVLDLGLLAAWLVWFFRLRDAGDDDPEDDGGGGSGPRPGDRPGPREPGRPLPSGRWRLRDHSRGPAWRPRRRARPTPGPLPARVRRARPRVPAHRA